jgi:hypothetical protein
MRLNWNLTTKGMRPHGQLQTKLGEKVAKLGSHLEHFPPDAVHLQVNLERHAKKPLFAAALTLSSKARRWGRTLSRRSTKP